MLDNKLINRRELTSQRAKARRELVEAMLERGSQARLGLEGYGPEVAMGSVLEATGIHRQEEGAWGFYPQHSPALRCSRGCYYDAPCHKAGLRSRLYRSSHKGECSRIAIEWVEGLTNYRSGRYSFRVTL